MFRRIAVPFCLVNLVATPLAGQELQGREGSRFTWSERISSGQWLRVYGINGRIEVTQATGDAAEVIGEKVLRRGRPEDIAFEIRRVSDGIIICAIIDDDVDCNDDGIRSRGRRNDRNERRVNFTVRVPHGVKVAAQSGNGDVRVEGVTAEVRAASGNGDVSVSTTGGPVNASSGNGEVSVTRAAGPVRASSGNGDVVVATTRGPVSASSGNGDVEVSMDAIEDVPEDMEFSSGNGTVTVTVPENFNGELVATTGSGKFVSDFPLTIRGRIEPRRVRATIGRGGRRITISTGNGDVELKKK